MAKIQGIDVSEHQGNINWAVVTTAAGKRFAFIRIGWGEGNIPAGGVEDSQARQNIRDAKAFGMPWAPYFYGYARTMEEAHKEADFIVNFMKEFPPGEIPFPIWYDTEDQKYQGDIDVNPIINAVGERVEQAGYIGGFYCSLSWLREKISAATRARWHFWLAQYNDVNDALCDVWQYSSTGQVPGIETNVDLNIDFMDYLAGVKVPAPLPVISTPVLEPIYSDPVFSLVEEQRVLNLLNYGSLETDGIDGAYTIDARINCQRGYGIEADGIPGKVTEYYQRGQLRAVQNRLNELGYPVDVDGRLGDSGMETINAVMALQAANGLEVDGIVGSQTFTLMFIQGAAPPAPPVTPEPAPPAAGMQPGQMTEHFYHDEFKCDCDGQYCDGFPVEINHTLVAKMERVRQRLNAPIVVTSGVRCEVRNAEVGGVPYSKHKRGEAVDCYTPGMDDDKVRLISQIAQEEGLNTIEYYEQQFVHCEV